MFEFGSLACRFVAGFVPIFSDSYDCSLTFVVAMTIACIASLILRYNLKSLLHSFLGGLACYFTCLVAVTVVSETLHPTGHFDFGWFLFACIFMLPRAAFSTSLGLAAWEAFRIAKSYVSRGT